MNSNLIDPIHTAVLSMDLQSGIVSAYAPEAEKVVERAATVLEKSRAAGLTVIYVKVEFRPGMPEVNSRNQLFGGIKASPRHQQLFAGAAGKIHPVVDPLSGDLVVSKSRVNAFCGTDLELLLRAKEIDALVLFGIATSGVVLSTLLHASDNDYRLFVIKDCCTDLETDLHSNLVEKVFTRRATVLSAHEFIDLL